MQLNSQEETASAVQNTCKRGKQHLNQPVMMICLQKECTNNRKCCLVCVDQMHSKHDIVSLHKFKTYVSQVFSHHQRIKNSKQTRQVIEQTQKSFEKKLQRVVQSFLEKVEAVKASMHDYFKELKLSLEYSFDDKLEWLNKQFSDTKVDEILVDVKQIQQNCIQSPQEIRKYMETNLNFLSSRCDNLIKQTEKNLCLVQQIIKSFKITAEIKNTQLIFNQDTKATCLVLGDDKKTVSRGQGVGGYPIVLVSHPFTQANNEFRFRITKEPEKKGMWLGVCVKDIVKNNKYLSCYGAGKGTWAIDQVGVHHTSAYSWSHHDSNYNSTPKVGWQFHIGDIISLKIDFKKSTVRFTRNNDIYEQPILLNLGEIYAFVGPTNMGDTYEIV